MIGKAEHTIIFIVTRPINIPEALTLTVLQPSCEMSRDESCFDRQESRLHSRLARR